MARPPRWRHRGEAFAVVGEPVEVRHHARPSGAVEGEPHRAGDTAARSGSWRTACAHHLCLAQPQLTDHVRGPVLESSPTPALSPGAGRAATTRDFDHAGVKPGTMPTASPRQPSALDRSMTALSLALGCLRGERRRGTGKLVQRPAETWCRGRMRNWDRWFCFGDGDPPPRRAGGRVPANRRSRRRNRCARRRVRSHAQVQRANARGASTLNLWSGGGLLRQARTEKRIDDKIKTAPRYGLSGAIPKRKTPLRPRCPASVDQAGRSTRRPSRASLISSWHDRRLLSCTSMARSSMSASSSSAALSLTSRHRRRRDRSRRRSNRRRPPRYQGRHHG